MTKLRTSINRVKLDQSYSGFVSSIFRSYFDLKASYLAEVGRPHSEARLLAYAFFIGIILFLTKLPVLMTGHLSLSDGSELTSRIGMTLFSSLFFVPLFLYILAGLTHTVSIIFRGEASFYQARLAFFWAIIVSSPFLLIDSLVQEISTHDLLALILEGLAVFFCAWIFSVVYSAAENFKSHWILFFSLLVLYFCLSILTTG